VRARLVLLLLSVCLLAGCSSLDLSKSVAKPRKLKLWGQPADQPARVVAVWSDALYNEPGKPSVRGFGGRLYFYDRKNQAVPVDGQLVVYGYDDSLEGAPAKEPERKFVFAAEQLSTHYTPSELGPSYSIWLPWEPVGGFTKTVSLLPVFTSAKGDVLTGQQAINTLPGKTPPHAQSRSGVRSTPALVQASGAVQPATYEQPAPPMTGGVSAGDLAGPAGDPSRRLRTTTFALPLSLTQRLTQPTASAAAASTGSTPETGHEGNASANPAAALPGYLPSAQDPLPAASNSAATEVTAPVSTPPAAPRSTRFERPRYRAPRGAVGR
jgi:hypothetical protein